MRADGEEAIADVVRYGMIIRYISVIFLSRCCYFNVSSLVIVFSLSRVVLLSLTAAAAAAGGQLLVVVVAFTTLINPWIRARGRQK